MKKKRNENETPVFISTPEHWNLFLVSESVMSGESAESSETSFSLSLFLLSRVIIIAFELVSVVVGVDRLRLADLARLLVLERVRSLRDIRSSTSSRFSTTGRACRYVIRLLSRDSKILW